MPNDDGRPDEKPISLQGWKIQKTLKQACGRRKPEENHGEEAGGRQILLVSHIHSLYFEPEEDEALEELVRLTGYENEETLIKAALDFFGRYFFEIKTRGKKLKVEDRGGLTGEEFKPG